MKKQDKFSSIRNKIILSFISLTVISLICVSSIVYVKVYSQTKDDYVRAISNEIYQVDTGLNNYMKSIEENTEMIITSSIIREWIQE